MKPKIIQIMLIITFGLFNHGCSSQNAGDKPDPDDRLPAVAGQFYSDDPTELKNVLKEFFKKAISPLKENKELRAIIVPHAGYVFSGQVAASGFNQIDPDRKYKRIFVIGSSHRTAFDAASVYCRGSFVTPLGKVAVDTAAAGDLIKNSSVFQFYKDAHMFEHSLEVEIPFLQYHLKNPFTIVPIVLGTDSPKTIEKIATGLKPYMNDDNLFVISTDFSHYPKYKDAVEVDKLTSDAILRNDPDELIRVIRSNEAKKIQGLATSLCGWTSVLTLLNMTNDESSLKYQHIQYMNSGDTPYGDSTRVVGYNAIAVFGPVQQAKEEFALSDKDKKDLLGIARKTIVSYIGTGKKPEIDDSQLSDNIKKNCGAFVTLHKEGQLRGCIGRFTADIPLYRVVMDMAVSSSTEDYRFTPVVKGEIEKLEIEISVLSPMKKISSIDEIEMGKHGIYITDGSRGGTFLPQVATETGWSREEFLGHCAQDKAGMGWDGWKKADIYIYTAIVFSEKEFNK